MPKPTSPARYWPASAPPFSSAPENIVQQMRPGSDLAPAKRSQTSPRPRAGSWSDARKKAANWAAFFALSHLLEGLFRSNLPALHGKERLHRIVHRLEPRRVMNRRHSPGTGRFERLVAVADDGMLLVVLPLLELVHRHVDVEFRIVGRVAQLAHIVCLEVDLLERILQRLFALHPGVVILLHRLLRRQLDAAEDHVARVPGLRIEHGEGVELVLHAEIDELRIIEP